MSHPKPTILVTGGAGYIGSHAVLALQKAGYGTIVLDSLEYGHRSSVEDVLKTELVVGQTTDRPLLDKLFSTHNIAAVMHFAAYIAVGESVQNPARYYHNNVVGTLTLLEAMLEADVKRFVFSSTAATYGVPQSDAIAEDHPQIPINPYGESKLMVEKMLRDFDAAYGLKSMIFRYFNAAGADPSGAIGEDHTPETHLLPLILFAAMGKRDNIAIFGSDYDTPDGTCIRDYVHVNDLAAAHVAGVQYLLDGGDSDAFNLGNGSGFSVREAIEAARRITGCEIPVVERDRRPGDPPILVSSSAKVRETLGWKPLYPDLDAIVSHAWQWHQKRHG